MNHADSMKIIIRQIMEFPNNVFYCEFDVETHNKTNGLFFGCEKEHLEQSAVF